MAARPESAARAPALNPADIPGNVQGALEDVNVPSYVVDRFGIPWEINAEVRT